MAAPCTAEVIAIANCAVRVLLVDDQMLVRAGLRAVLAPLPDIEIVGEAHSGAEAIAFVMQCHPDVVILDLDMPGEGGLAAIRTLTAVEPHPAVLALSMRPEEEGLVDALRAGAAGYITKSIARFELMAAIRSAADGDVYVRPYVACLLARTLRQPPRASPDGMRLKYDGLSQREQTVLRLVAEGYTGPEIGRSLGITAKTVDTYRRRVQQKIGLARRKDYVRFALLLGLLTK